MGDDGSILTDYKGRAKVSLQMARWLECKLAICDTIVGAFEDALRRVETLSDAQNQQLVGEIRVSLNEAVGERESISRELKKFRVRMDEDIFRLHSDDE